LNVEASYRGAYILQNRRINYSDSYRQAEGIREDQIEIQLLIRYIASMTRIIANLLILLVLFTHSTMAMDVHFPHDTLPLDKHVTLDIAHSDDHTEHLATISSIDEAADIEQAMCADAGGHCSHHQAHTAGLISVNTLPNTKVQPVLLSQFEKSVFIHTQSPPLRPPKV
jgi:hypothetical protein